MIFKTIIIILYIALSAPGKLVRKLKLQKIKILIRALRNEPSQQIIANFKRYIFSEEYSNLSENRSFLSANYKEEVLLQKLQLFHDFIQSGSIISFPKQKPFLSIIIVLYNKVGLSFACLQSILKNIQVNYEVILVDNNSTDETTLLLDRIQGATIIRNKENLHFLKANNQALRYVKGGFLLFLNNDTEIAESTIPSAINTLISNDKFGAVGAKLILPDGSLQEAGSIIWSDASCLGYGRNANHLAPEFNFKRVVDYCSGAFLLTYTNLFKKHEGFDSRFAPAYYEETDYCLWLQEQGKEVVYDPNAVVYHFEFGSGMPENAVALHLKNQLVFHDKHNKQLENHFAPDLSNVLNARFSASHKGRKKVLYVDDRVPHCDFGSGFPRSNSIVRFLVELNCDLTIFPLNFPDEDNWETAYRDIDPFIEIALGYGLSGFEKFIKNRENYYDVIWVSRPHNLEMISGMILFMKGKCKIVYDAEAIFTDRIILEKEMQGKVITAEKMDKLYQDELKISEIADVVTSVSLKDAKTYKEYGHKNVHVLGHTLKVNDLIPEFNQREGILFVGNLDYNTSPNVDSLLWFINDVFPLIRKEIPGVTLDVVGAAGSSKIQKIKGDDIFVRGRVDSLGEFYNRSKVFIAPTRFAAGIPFKIHESASFGLPVVATQLLCNQLGWRNEEEILAAPADKYDFARQVIRLYHNEHLWGSIQNKALSFVKNEMSNDSYKRTVAQILNELI